METLALGVRKTETRVKEEMYTLYGVNNLSSCDTRNGVNGEWLSAGIHV